MKAIVSRAVFVFVMLVTAVLGVTGTAQATHVKMEILMPTRITVGDTVDVRAVLHSVREDTPIAGATVIFYMQASFGGVNSEVELGRAVTDESGVADIDYYPRSAGDHQIRVEYMTPDSSDLEEATWSHSVVSDGQLYRSTAGVRIPGLNAWLLMAVVAGVWIILLSVAWRVIVIARAGGDDEVPRASRMR